MNSIFYSVIILLLLTGAILFLMWEVNKKTSWWKNRKFKSN